MIQTDRPKFRMMTVEAKTWIYQVIYGDSVGLIRLQAGHPDSQHHPPAPWFTPVSSMLQFFRRKQFMRLQTQSFLSFDTANAYDNEELGFKKVVKLVLLYEVPCHSNFISSHVIYKIMVQDDKDLTLKARIEQTKTPYGTSYAAIVQCDILSACGCSSPLRHCMDGVYLKWMSNMRSLRPAMKIAMYLSLRHDRAPTAAAICGFYSQRRTGWWIPTPNGRSCPTPCSWTSGFYQLAT